MPKSINDFSDNDIVISAEGVNSATRKSIYPNLKLRNSNQMLWRGISKIKLDEKFKNAYHSFIGGNLRFAIIHTGGDYYSWYAIKPKEGQEPEIRDKELLKKLFSHYHSLVNAVIDQSEHIHFSTLVDINPKDRRNLAWFQNKRLMIGDAIHPTTPNMANGACLAMEDAYLLAQLLNNGDLGLDEIYKTIQQRRTKKIDRIVFRSWWFGKLLHQRNSMLSFLIIKGISWTPQFFFDRIYAQVLMKD